MKAGLVGFGIMGRAIALRLRQQGHRIQVFDKADALESAETSGEREYVAESLAELAEQNDTVLVCVSGPAAEREVMFFSSGLFSHMRRNSVLINVGTSGVADTKEFETRAEQLGIRYIAAPICKGPEQVEKGESLLLVGSRDGAGAEAENELLTALGTVVNVGTAEQAASLRLVVQLMALAANAALMDGVRFIRKADISTDAFLGNAGRTGAESWQIHYSSRRLYTGHEFPIRQKVNTVLKDLKLILELAREKNVELPMTRAVADFYQTLANRGMGGEDYAVFNGEGACGQGGKNAERTSTER